jgi:hypothetical protein
MQGGTTVSEIDLIHDDGGFLVKIVPITGDNASTSGNDATPTARGAFTDSRNFRRVKELRFPGGIYGRLMG